jgi:hypothetical protein
MSFALEMAEKAVTRCEICKTRIRYARLRLIPPRRPVGVRKGDEFRGVRCVP